MKASNQTLQQKPHQTLRLNEQNIDRDALSIVERLQHKGFTTYLVGGCVRDLLLGNLPKDFDIATNARPNQVRQNVSNAFVIGRRFRLVLVKRGEKQYEVATFRRDPKPEDNTSPEEEVFGDNIFGSPEEDAQRRDFTINALFYDPVAHDLIDYARGLADLKAGVIRMIGDPQIRLVEDPIRIMRAIRLAHMIRFSLDPILKKGIKDHADKLPGTALPRRREEFLKYLRLTDPSQAFLTSADLGVLPHISPTITQLLNSEEKGDLLFKYLREFHQHEMQSPTELFAGLMMAFALSEFGEDLKSISKSHTLLEHPHLSKLMRDELGMFKSEQAEFAKAIHLLTILSQRSLWEKRGSRRRLAVIANPAFSLALTLAERTFWVSPTDLHFWREEKNSLLAQHPIRRAGPRSRRRRPRHKKPHKPNELNKT